VIVAASRLDNDYANRLEEIHIPIVVVNNQAEGDYQNLYSICIDDYAGGRLAMRHLLKLGHQRIGYSAWATGQPRTIAVYRPTGCFEEKQIEPQASWVCIDQTMTAGDLREISAPDKHTRSFSRGGPDGSILLL